MTPDRSTSEPGRPIRVALIDDQTLVRQGIRSLLELTEDIEVVAEAEDGGQAMTLLRHHEVDVLLLDLRMPRKDGLATLRELREAGTTVPVLVLTTFDDDELVLQALREGARGYLLKDVTLDQLITAVRTVAAGGNTIQPAMTDRLLRAVSSRSTGIPSLDRRPDLTSRELDVLRLAASGYSNREISHALHLSEGTVKNHMSSVLVKLGVRDRTRAVLIALELGLLTESDT
jgi:DNA-binding NarL/FixJ family response regulator